MASWWGVLVAVETFWVLVAWLLLGYGDPVDTARTGKGRERLRAIFIPAYFIYHLPFLLLDLLNGGWIGKLLEGKGWWLLVEAAIIGAVTVAIYGIVLSFFFGPGGG